MTEASLVKELEGLENSQYPFAAAPDIIRSNQKDSFFQDVLFEQLSNFLRGTIGARWLHKNHAGTRMTSEILYLCCTTLIGSRTLGEEYCDIVQVEGKDLRLPSIVKRSGYILCSVVFPYVLNRNLPKVKTKLHTWLESSLRASIQKNGPSAPETRIRRYLVDNISILTSVAPIYAIGLSVFYFSGAYYHISKRLFGLRYLFTKGLEPSDQRIGYEVLGVLLVLQMIVQTWLHIQNSYDASLPPTTSSNAADGGMVVLPGGVEMGLGHPQAEDLLLDNMPTYTNRESVRKITATPVLSQPRYHLSNPEMMTWIEAKPQRMCTLCLEEFRDPSVTTCGHVFCWTCIADWIKEKAECPLCRQSVLPQHILPIRE